MEYLDRLLRLVWQVLGDDEKNSAGSGGQDVVQLGNADI
jgi:hypothetical protein